MSKVQLSREVQQRYIQIQLECSFRLIFELLRMNRNVWTL